MPNLRETCLATIAAAALLGPATTASADPPTEPVPGVEPDKSLSKQLDENSGVISPPPVGDEEIHVEAPNATPGTTPVIPPSAIPENEPK
jgi:hypothetical protein